MLDAHPYLFLVVFILAAAGFALVPLLLARLWALKFSPAKPGDQKNATYECGLEAKGRSAHLLPGRVLPLRHHLPDL